MFLKYLLVFSLFFLSPDLCLSQEQSFFDRIEQTESITQPCTCDCHSRIYSYKECAICTHRGGMFYGNESHINIKNQINEGNDHE